MKNLLLALLVWPLLCSASDLQLIEVDPTKVFVDQGLYVEDEGIVIPAKNLILRDRKVYAVTGDSFEAIQCSGWIFVFPPDAVKYSPTRPMLNVSLDKEECPCGKKSFSPVAGCNCRPKKGGRTGYYVHEQSGDQLLSISEEEDELNYLSDFEAMVLLSETLDEEDYEDMVIGYNYSGAYYYNPNSFFQVSNPTQFNPHR